MAFLTARRVEINARLFGPASFVIGEDTFCAGMRAVVSKSHVHIGAGCLFSDEVLVQAGDQHGILDVGTRSYLNAAPYNLKVGRHVWIGRRAVICNRADIGDGSILGTAAVTAGKIPSLCAAVGNPARVVRKGVSWTLGEHEPTAGEVELIDQISSRHARETDQPENVLSRLNRFFRSMATAVKGPLRGQ